MATTTTAATTTKDAVVVVVPPTSDVTESSSSACRLPSLTAVPTTSMVLSPQQGGQQEESYSNPKEERDRSCDKHHDVTSSLSHPEDDDDDDDDVGISADQSKFREWMMPSLKLEMRLQRVLASEQTPYQKVDIIQTVFGKTLVLDGYTQSSQFDEFVYHESLVHPALLRLLDAKTRQCSHNPPQLRVFIGGGGELATARQVLRYPTVTKVVMVDLDERVVQLCRTHLPEWGGDAVLDDERLEMHYGDAFSYLMQQTCNDDAATNPFDLIIMDISDPVEAGPGIALYTQEFYTHAARLLSSPHGVFVTQSGAADAVPYHICNKDSENDTGMSLGPIRNTLATVFDIVLPYATHIASFGGDWGFCMACHPKQHITQSFTASETAIKASNDAQHSSQVDVQRAIVDWKQPGYEIINGLVEQHVPGGTHALRHYDGESHHRMFSLTKSLRQYLAEEARIMTKDNPIYTF